MLGLEGRRVVIAGAGGLGSACARGFLEAGATVVIADRNAEALEAFRSNSDAADRVHTIAVDFSEPDSGQRTIQHAVDILGGVDVAVHAIGANDRRPILDFTEDEWQRIMEINLSTAFRFGQAAGKHMTANSYGRVVFFSSVSGLLAHAHHAPYAASKGGINQMMRVMAREWASDNVTVNAVAPGYIETSLTTAYLEKPGVRDSLVSQVPAGRLSSQNDIVGPVLFLASDLASFVTGHILYVDGGRTLV